MNKTLDKIIRFFRFKVLFDNLPKKFNNILDIGCGSNPWFSNFNKNKLINAKIVGVDSENINFINKNKLLDFKFVNLKILKILPFKNEAFDLITMLAVLEHLDYPEEIVKEIYRILEPNGTLIITTPSKFAKPILEFLALKLNVINKESIASHKVYFDKKSLGKILIDAGFIIKKLNYFELGMNIFIKAHKRL